MSEINNIDTKWLTDASNKVGRILAEYKDDEDIVCSLGEQAIYRTIALLEKLKRSYSALELPGVTIDTSVIDLSWIGDGKKIEVLINNESSRIVYWDGKNSRVLNQDEVPSILKMLHRKPAHA